MGEGFRYRGKGRYRLRGNGKRSEGQGRSWGRWGVGGGWDDVGMKGKKVTKEMRGKRL